MSDWILLQSGIAIYAILFLMLLGGSVGLPIPEDLSLILGGVLAHRGNARTDVIVLVCYVGSILGDIIIYFAGRKIGGGVAGSKNLSEKFRHINFTKLKSGLEKRSFLMIFLARHLFYMRTVTFLACGAIKMDFKRFLLADSFAGLVSVPVMLSVGFLGSENYETIIRVLGKIKIFLAVASLIVIGLLIYFFRRHNNRARDLSGSVD